MQFVAQVVEYPAGASEPVRRPETEPAVTDVAGSARDLPLKVWAAADNARYTCGAPLEGITFKPTMMFQVEATYRIGPGLYMGQQGGGACPS